MIELTGVTKRFPPRATLLAGIDLRVERGARWGLIGPGASGKSVLLKLICRLLEPDAGRIVADGLAPVTTSKIYDLPEADDAETRATVIAVSSDVDALRRFPPRIAMLYEGRLRYDGPADTIADCEDPVVRQFVRGDLEGPL